MSKKKENKKESKLKSFFTSYQFLYTTMALLLVIIIVLGVIIIGKKREKDSANIIIPVMEKSSHSSLSIDLNSLKNKEYKIKITNYRNDNVNEEEILYSLIVKNDTKASILLYKEDTDNNLMIDQKETTLKDYKLEGNKKDSSIFIIKLKEGSKVSKDDKITVEITS